jgi:isoleucyl-tRNA synthetase
VHLASFPVAQPPGIIDASAHLTGSGDLHGTATLVDHQLMDATRLAMKISSMGRAARSKAGVKVRQPLAQVLIKPRLPEEVDYIARISPQFMDELNVKNYYLLDDSSDLYHQAQQAGGEDTETVVKVGQYSVSLDAGYLVAVDAAITPELAQEGLARELAHRIQNLRKDAGFEITDRIVTYYQGPEEVGMVMRNHADYIEQETLSEKLVPGAPEDGAKTETQKVEGMEVTLGVRRV